MIRIMGKREKERKRKREKGRILLYTWKGYLSVPRCRANLYHAVPPGDPSFPLLSYVRQRREIKGATGGRKKGKREEKRKWKEKKREILYLEISAPAAARRNVPRNVCTARERAFISPFSCICRRLSALRRRGVRYAPFIFGSALRSNRHRVKPTCSRHS